MNNFQCTLSGARIRTLASRYRDDREFDAMRAGQRIRQGDFTFVNLAPIVDWKSTRARSRVRENKVKDVEDVLRVVITPDYGDRLKVAALTGLCGVAVPMASAIMTAIYPDDFTVIDYRALETLGVKNPSPTVGYYLDYLNFCRTESKVRDVSLREFDKALWQQSKSGNSN